MDYQEFPDLGLSYTLAITEKIRAIANETAQKSRGAPEPTGIIQHTMRELRVLYEVAAGFHDTDLVEGYALQCGIFCGGSACVMGHALKDANKDYFPVVAIDSYTKEYEPLRATFDKAYQESRENIWALGLSNFVTTVISDDTLFLRNFWHSPIRVAFVDSSHHYEHTKEEIKLLMPYIVENGWLIFHDYFSEKTPGVTQAVNEFLEMKQRRPTTVFRADGLLLLRVGPA